MFNQKQALLRSANKKKENALPSREFPKLAARVPKCILAVLSPKCERIKEMGFTVSFEIST